jgi:DNA uptake protein ComE-like DNA-binding protein
MTNEQELNLAELMEKIGEDVATAFLVYQTLDGSWTATADFQDKNLNLERKATFDDIVGGASAVQAGCIAQQSAMHTVMLMEQRAAAMQQYAREQAESQKVSQLIDPSKLRNPRA